MYCPLEPVLIRSYSSSSLACDQAGVRLQAVETTARVYYTVEEVEKQRAIGLLPSLDSALEKRQKENPQNGGLSENAEQPSVDQWAVLDSNRRLSA